MASGPIYPVSGLEISKLKDAVLIVPSVSLGNVPQLAGDLLVSSLGLPRVAFVGMGDTVAPFAGFDTDAGILTGGLELYGSEQGIYVLLQRSPTLKTKKDEHVALIAAAAASFGSVLVLASLDAANQDDAQLLTPHQAIVQDAPGSVLGRLAQLPPLNLRLEGAPPQQASQGTYPPFLPGAGLTRRVLAALKEQGTPGGALAAWVVEGDNRGDAHALAARTLQITGTDAELREPASWKGLFGGEGWSGGTGADAEIYG